MALLSVPAPAIAASAVLGCSTRSQLYRHQSPNRSGRRDLPPAGGGSIVLLEDLAVVQGLVILGDDDEQRLRTSVWWW